MSMQSLHQTWSPFTLQSSAKQINKKPPYQRGEVWSEQKKQRLIDSILRSYDIPKFYLAPSTHPYSYEVVDGQQRITAILDFMSGKFPISDEFELEGTQKDLEGLFFEDMPIAVKTQFGNFPLSVVVLTNATDVELRDLFKRLQEGVVMNEAEKRNALMGNMRDFIVELAKHKVFKSIHIPSDRFAWDDLAAHVMCVELASGPTDIKAKNLGKMYEDHKKFDKKSSVASKVKKVLNFINKGLQAKSSPEMNIKWGFVDLYLLITKFLDEYSLKDLEQSFIDFYVDFEQFRRQNYKTYKELAAGSIWERRLFDYIEAFRTSGGTRSNIEIRHSVYKEFALKYFAEKAIDLIPKDSKRTFTIDERLVIWRRANGQCQNASCERTTKDIAFNEMEADHIVPHSRGGKTIISNGQCLCVDCNRRKSASL